MVIEIDHFFSIGMVLRMMKAGKNIRSLGGGTGTIIRRNTSRKNEVSPYQSFRKQAITFPMMRTFWSLRLMYLVL